MKSLASSIAKESKKEKIEGGECESYGKFLAESLKKGMDHKAYSAVPHQQCIISGANGYANARSIQPDLHRHSKNSTPHSKVDTFHSNNSTRTLELRRIKESN